MGGGGQQMLNTEECEVPFCVLPHTVRAKQKESPLLPQDIDIFFFFYFPIPVVVLHCFLRQLLVKWIELKVASHKMLVLF